jgi:hypothetical protein
MYNVVTFLEKLADGVKYTRYMINGEIARWDDDDYSDPDYHRQLALDTCARHLDNGKYCGEGGEYLPLSEVVGNLKLEDFWNGGVVPMSEEEACLAQLEILTAIVRLNEKEGCESFDLKTQTPSFSVGEAVCWVDYRDNELAAEVTEVGADFVMSKETQNGSVRRFTLQDDEWICGGMQLFKF